MSIPQEQQRKIEQARQSKSTELDLSNGFFTGDADKLTEIPDEIFELTHLQKLNLSGNKIAYLPSEISNLENLTSLDLSSNQLKNLPDTIGSLRNLTELKLSFNQLEKLPDTIGNLTNLRKLLLDYNELYSLPETITNLDNNIELYLRKNLQLGKPPFPTASKGIKAIKEYFEAIQQEGEEEIYEAKLIIVGEPNEGKTSLAKKIQNPNSKLNPEERKTEGVKIFPWEFSSDGIDYKVNIWDFGGQIIQQAAHKFFLTKRSLYCLVINTRNNTNIDKVQDWLELIRLYSNNSPVLIILNEQDNSERNSIQKDINNFKPRFNIKETYRINLEDNRGLENIFSAIYYNIENLVKGVSFPRNWSQVRKELEHLRWQEKKDYIRKERFVKICENNGIEESKAEALSEDFHALGIFLHYQKTSLKKTIILNPEWATNAVYQLNKKAEENSGRFKEEEFEKIWTDKKYKDMYFELLKLMEEFEFCYKINPQKSEYIVPFWLSRNKPSYNWNKMGNLIVFFKYDESMPKDIISRFIVKTHRYIKHENYVWKTGVVLEDDGAMAEIIKCYREIKISIDGKNKQKLINYICRALKEINQDYDLLKYNQFIPCNCGCAESDDPHFYRLKSLENRLSKGHEYIECNTTGAKIRIQSLIGDVTSESSERNEPDSEKKGITVITQINTGNGSNVAKDQINNNKY